MTINLPARPYSSQLISDGPAGTRQVLKEMARLVRNAKTSQPLLRRMAIGIISHVPAKAWISEIRAVFNFVRERITYRLDTVDVEVVQSPEFTIESGSGDCDDFCVILATLLECVGHPCRFVALSFEGPGDYSHVVLQTRGAGSGPWITLDATEDQPMGWFPPGVTGQMVQDI